jgi:hypothetical protein
MQRGGPWVAEPAAMGQCRQGGSVSAMTHAPEGYHTVTACAARLSRQSRRGAIVD